MPIENRNLESGTVLSARYKKEDRTCEVVQTDAATPGSAQSGLRYRLDDGTEHKSPSSAGKAVTGGACNGWVFWSIAGTEKPKRTGRSTASREPKAKAETPAKAPKAEKAAKTKKAPAKKGKAKSGKKPKAMRAAATSDASYGCGACGETFPTQKAAIDHAMTHTS